MKVWAEIPVAIVDDDAALREAMQFVLASVGIEAVAYASAKEFLTQASQQHYRCVVLDVRMPGLSGLEAQRRLKEMGEQSRIIFITGHGDVDMAVEAMKQGAADFLQKPFKDQVLINAVQVALQNEEEVVPNDSDRIAAAKERFEHLTPRERDILACVSQGLRSKQIAAELGIAIKTVEEYRSRVLEKMGVSSSCELTALVTESRVLHQP